MERGFYNLDIGGSADRAPPFIVHRIAHYGEQARASVNHIKEVGATTKVTAIRLRRMDKDHDQTRNHIEALPEEVTAARAEVREFSERQVALERHMIEEKLQVTEARVKIRVIENFISSFHGPQSNTRRE